MLDRCREMRHLVSQWKHDRLMGALSAIRETRACQGGADIPVCSLLPNREVNLGFHQIQVVK